MTTIWSTASAKTFSRPADSPAHATVLNKFSILRRGRAAVLVHAIQLHSRPCLDNSCSSRFARALILQARRWPCPTGWRICLSVLILRCSLVRTASKHGAGGVDGGGARRAVVEGRGNSLAKCGAACFEGAAYRRQTLEHLGQMDDASCRAAGGCFDASGNGAGRPPVDIASLGIFRKSGSWACHVPRACHHLTTLQELVH
eukprot:5892648-Pleurochrysis_carterae.AAC.1